MGAVILLAGCARTGPAPLAVEEKFTQWARYEGEPGASHYSALDQINRSNVAQLQVAWEFQTGGPASASYNPIVIDTIMYVIGAQNSIVAVHAGNGRELWRHTSAVPGAISARGIMYWENDDRTDRRLLFTKGNHDLVSINALTGQPVTSFGTGGRQDLRGGLGRDPLTLPRTTSGSPGVIFEDVIVMGGAVGEGYVAGPGHIRGFDVRTGRQLWIFHTLPKPGEVGYDTWPAGRSDNAGGANAWGGMSVDDKRGIVYVPLGSANYDFYGVDRPGDNLFANSVVALDARTGRRLWHFQTVHHDLWDYDLTATPTLLTIRQNGQARDVVAQASKQGFLFVFDRVTGEPIWPIEERPVPPSDMPGEITSPTQPFPTVVPPFAVQKFEMADLNPYIAPEERQEMYDRLNAMLNRGLYTPPSTTPTMQMPGNRGGANWGSTAADPTDGTFYVLTHNVPYVLKLEAITPGAVGTGGSPIDRGQVSYANNCAACHGANRQGQPASGFPSLVGISDRMSHVDFLDIVKGGRGQMPAFGTLQDQEIDAILAYLANPGMALNAVGVEAARGPDGSSAGETPSAPVRYQSGWNAIRDQRGMPVVRPPWFTITAYDLNRGTIKWQVPVGEASFLAAQGITNTGSPSNLNGGPTITAGGLVFQITNNKLRALDKETGAEITAITLPGNAGSIPTTYQVGGRQYIVVNMSGGGGGGGGGGQNPAAAAAAAAQNPPRFIAYALPLSAIGR